MEREERGERKWVVSLQPAWPASTQEPRKLMRKTRGAGAGA